MWWLHMHYRIGRICDLHNHCRRKTGLPSSYSLQTTRIFEFPNMKWCNQLKMNNLIHLHWIPFLLAEQEVKIIFNQHLKIPMIDTPKRYGYIRYRTGNSPSTIQMTLTMGPLIIIIMVNQYLNQRLIGSHTPGMILSHIIMQRIGTNWLKVSKLVIQHIMSR